MKYGTSTKAAAFLVYEYAGIKNLGKILDLNDEDEINFFIFEDEVHKNSTITAVYNDTGFKLFYSVDNSVEDLTSTWREFNKKHNGVLYEKHMQSLLEMQKDTFKNNENTINLEEFLKEE